MKSRLRLCELIVSGGIVFLGGVAMAQDEGVPLSNWGAPPYWTPPVQAVEGEPGGGMTAHELGMTTQAEALPSSPLPFVAIAPCRIVDTRVAVSDGFHEPNFSDGETRTFNLPASPDCAGLPSTAGAWSLNVQFRPISQLAFLTAYPGGTTRPGVSTMTAGPAAWVQNAAVVPAGTGGAIDVYCQFAGRVVIDINGYYGPQSVVTSLNTMAGDLALAAGSNIAITPSAGTLTIAMTGVPGGTLPAGSAGQTLYSNGSGWLASSALTNDGTDVGITGTLSLPTTTATTGQIKFGGSPFIHKYGTASTFVGDLAGNFSMTGTYNTGIGTESLLGIGSGSNNTGVGTVTLFNDGSGSNNTGVGSFALFSNGTASQNTAVGSFALSNQSYDPGSPWASDNTAVGYDALANNEPTSVSTGVRNTAIGSQALQASTTGSGNTASGFQSLYSTTTGYSNTASGSQSLMSNTTGYQNTASGENSLHSNTTGFSNTANGSQSLYFNTTGGANTASGYQSLNSNTTGSWNTASGSQSLFFNTTGHDNTASGNSAGFVNTTGFDNTFIGSTSDAAANNLSNATAIGYAAIVDASNHVRIGDTAVTQIGGQVAWSNLSDARHKDNIRDLDLGLDLVLALRPVAFTLKSGDGRTDMGFLAQDVESLLGDGYSVLGFGGDKDRTLSLRYTDLIAPLVKAIQEQQATIEVQQAQIAEQRDALARQGAENETIMGRVETQQGQIRSLAARLAASEAQKQQLDAVTARLAALERRLPERQ